MNKLEKICCHLAKVENFADRELLLKNLKLTKHNEIIFQNVIYFSCDYWAIKHSYS